MYANIMAQKQAFNNGDTIHIHYQQGGNDYKTMSHLTIGTIISDPLNFVEATIEDTIQPSIEPIESDPTIVKSISGSLTILAGSGTPGLTNGLGTNAMFHSPTGITLDINGTLYVADSLNYCIRKITTNGEVTTLVGSGIGYADGSASMAQFNRPESLTITTLGILYVVDTNNSKIRKIEGDSVTTFAGSIKGYADGLGTNAQFNFPGGITVDSSGVLYVADAKNHRIRQITPDGNVTTLAGSMTNLADSIKGFCDGVSEISLFSYPSGIAVDSSGTLYIADKGNNRIRSISKGIVSTIAGGGFEFGVCLRDGLGTNAIFNSPSNIVLDVDGMIYVTDTGNNCIRTITPTGIVSTLANTKCPYGIVIDPTSSILYVTDPINNRVLTIHE